MRLSQTWERAIYQQGQEAVMFAVSEALPKATLGKRTLVMSAWLHLHERLIRKIRSKFLTLGLSMK